VRFWFSGINGPAPEELLSNPICCLKSV